MVLTLTHQCSKGFWPRLFSSFCLGFKPDAYWDETKRRNLWSRLQRNQRHRGTFLLRVYENRSHLHAPAFRHRATNLQQRTEQQRRRRAVHHGITTFIATHLRQHTTAPLVTAPPCFIAPVTAHLTMTATTSEPAATTTFTMRETVGRSPWSRAGGS